MQQLKQRMYQLGLNQNILFKFNNQNTKYFVLIVVVERELYDTIEEFLVHNQFL